MNQSSFLKWFLICIGILFTAMVVSIFVMSHTVKAPSSLGDQTQGNEVLPPDPNFPNGILPDSRLTPGVPNPDISQDNIADNICNKGWSTKSIRPTASYTTALKVKQLAGDYAYEGITDTKLVEEDHLISLELGGSPTDPGNLWPEPYSPVPGAKQKDQVENFLHREVCDGTISLQEAQAEVSTNWYSLYLSMTSPANVGGVPVSTTDPDDN